MNLAESHGSWDRYIRAAVAISRKWMNANRGLSALAIVAVVSFAAQHTYGQPSHESRSIGGIAGTNASFETGVTWDADLPVNGARRGPSVSYVDVDATGAGTGLSWTDAFVSLRDALAAAAPGMEIWVAAGTYRPTDKSCATAAGDCAAAAIAMLAFGDATNDGFVDVGDILCALDGFAGVQSCPMERVDISPCEGAGPDGFIDVGDILAFLDAFSGTSLCPNHCPPP